MANIGFTFQNLTSAELDAYLAEYGQTETTVEDAIATYFAAVPQRLKKTVADPANVSSGTALIPANARVDIDVIVDEVFNNSPLLDIGWTEDTDGLVDQLELDLTQLGTTSFKDRAWHSVARAPIFTLTGTPNQGSARVILTYVKTPKS